MNEADPRFVIPHRKKLHLEIDQILHELRFKLSNNIQHGQKLSFCADIWSKPGMSASFLGVTCHYFNHQDNKRHQVTLAVRRFPSPHTADRLLEVFESVILDWKISHSKVYRVLTDNGSNIVAAFKRNVYESCQSTNSESENEKSDDELENIGDEEEEENETDDHDDIEQVKEGLRNEMQQCEELEDEHHAAFFQYKRISCAIHTLQLVVKLFEGSPCFHKTLKKAKKIVAKVNKSTKATEKLIEKANKKLVGDCPTRWDSTYLMLTRMVSVKVHLNNVLDELLWDGLSATQWKQLESILELLQPFAHFTNVASSEQLTSVGMIFPLLQELSLHLGEVS